MNPIKVNDRYRFGIQPQIVFVLFFFGFKIANLVCLYSKIPRRASFDSSATASLTRVIFGTTVLSLRLENTSSSHKAEELTISQTWEDPNVIHPETKAKGDNDPLDVCEIGELVGYPGQVKQVKILGVMALLDEEETDWKVIVIDVNDPLAPKLNDVEDVERHLPGLLRATNEWFRIYKIPDGKPENQFAFTGECKNKKYVYLPLLHLINANRDRYATHSFFQKR